MIGVVTTSYPRFADDAAGVFVRERVRALRAGGQEVEVLAAGDGGRSPADDAWVTRIAAPGLFYAGGAPEALEGGRRQRGLAWTRALGFSTTLLARLAERRGRWQAVESHWLLPCGVAAAAALPGLPHRAHVHGGDVYLLGRLPWAGSVARTLCRTSPELVFASASLLDRFAAVAGASPDVLGARSLVEAAPFDRSIFSPPAQGERAAARGALGYSRPTVLAAGRLVPIKGFDRVLDAIATLAPPRPTVVIAGEGAERAELERRARALGIDLRLLGQVGQGELARHMAAADVLVHACRALPNGRSEGMPLVVREALARGLPVVASASGGIKELGGNVGLVLVAPGDVRALGQAIARVLDMRGGV